MSVLFTGGLVVGLPFSNPIVQGGLTLCLHGGTSTSGFPLFVMDSRLIGAAPKKQLVMPGPVNALGLDFGLHAGSVELKRDRTIAASSVKTTRARA